MRRSHALAGAAIAVALAAVADPRFAIPVALAATAASLALPGRWLPGVGPRLALAAGAWALAGRIALGAQVAPPTQPHEQSLEAIAGRWTATVEAVTRRAGGRQSAVLRVPGAGLVFAQLPRYPEFTAGDRVAVDGRLEPLPASPEPETEGWVAYLRRIGVSGTLEARAASREAYGDDLGARLAQIREGAGDLLGAALAEPQAGLAAGILVGLRERVDPGLARDFTAAGLTHVVAISGWNIAIVAGTCGAIARPLSRRRRSLVIGVTVAAYALLAGGSPSVVRAALMAGIALLAREAGRHAGASRALALAVGLMLAIDPGAVVDPGFQLSAVATAGIVTWASPLGERIARTVPRIPGTIRESLAVSLSAQLATLPIVLFDFGRLSLVSPLANLVVAPLVPVVMAGAALALPLGALLAGGFPAVIISVPLALAAIPLAALVFIARVAASVPLASIELPTPIAVPVAALAGLAALLLARARRQPDGRLRTAR